MTFSAKDLPDERQLLAPDSDLVFKLRSGETCGNAWTEVEPLDRRAGHLVGDVVLGHMRDVTWFPASGLLFGSDGRPVRSALISGGGKIPKTKGRRREKIAKAAVFLGAGSLRNYGHFLFDGITSLIGLSDLGLLGAFPPFCAPLSSWQRQIMAQAGITPNETQADEAKLEEVVFLTSMNHYLHRCNRLILPMVARMGGRGSLGKDVVYLSRRRYSGRILLSEASLECALAAEGVKILAPETMTVLEQITAMQTARIVIAPSGAALANVIFAPSGASVIEIRPETFQEPWMKLTCSVMELNHRVIPARLVQSKEVPIMARIKQLPRRITGRYHFVMDCSIEAVLLAVREQLR